MGAEGPGPGLLVPSTTLAPSLRSHGCNLLFLDFLYSLLFPREARLILLLCRRYRIGNEGYKPCCLPGSQLVEEVASSSATAGPYVAVPCLSRPHSIGCVSCTHPHLLPSCPPALILTAPNIHGLVCVRAPCQALYSSHFASAQTYGAGFNTVIIPILQRRKLRHSGMFSASHLFLCLMRPTKGRT